MQRLQHRLISLVREKEITYKDMALILLSKDGIKPLSSVSFSSSPKLLKILKEYKIPFTLRDGRVFIGESVRKCGTCHFNNSGFCAYKQACENGFNNGTNFGFPACCSAVFLSPEGWFLSKQSRASFSSSFSSLSPYVFHVPCSEKCAETVKLAQKYMHHVQQKYPIVAERIQKALA